MLQSVFMPPLLLPVSPYWSTSRSACGSTRMPQCGAPNSRCCAHSRRRSETCSTTASSSRPLTAMTPSSWRRRGFCGITHSPLRKACHIWRWGLFEHLPPVPSSSSQAVRQMPRAPSSGGQNNKTILEPAEGHWSLDGISMDVVMSVCTIDDSIIGLVFSHSRYIILSLNYQMLSFSVSLQDQSV